MVQIVFVCLGNICRSPLAEGIMKKLVEERGLDSQIKVDSAGTSRYHIGEIPHQYSRKTAENNGFSLDHRGRQFKIEDFEKFDYIIAMDQDNFENMEEMTKNKDFHQKLYLMREFDDAKSCNAVEDPYGEDLDTFQECYNILEESCENFLDVLEEKHSF